MTDTQSPVRGTKSTPADALKNWRPALRPRAKAIQRHELEKALAAEDFNA